MARKPKVETKRARGRPTAYKAEYAAQAEKLTILGATDVEIADFFGVHTATVYRWKHDHPDFCEALNAGKAKADERVINSLFQKAVGYTFESEKVFQHRGQIVRAATREHVPPDTTAAIFWLKNRKPDDWRDKQEVEHSGALEMRMKAAADELDAELDRLIDARAASGAEKPQS